MADKLTKEEVQATLLGHLTQFSERVAAVVDDYNDFQNEKDMPPDGKLLFAEACMKDVVTLTGVLTQFVHETLIAAGLESTPAPATEADIIELDAYRSGGGLLN